MRALKDPFDAQVARIGHLGEGAAEGRALGLPVAV
jgi:hypothetical protein